MKEGLFAGAYRQSSGFIGAIVSDDKIFIGPALSVPGDEKCSRHSVYAFDDIDDAVEHWQGVLTKCYGFYDDFELEGFAYCYHKNIRFDDCIESYDYYMETKEKD